MRSRIAVNFVPAAFGLALRRGTGCFAARPYRQRVPEPWLLDQPLPPKLAWRGRITRRWALVPPWPPSGGLSCERKKINIQVLPTQR